MTKWILSRFLPTVLDIGEIVLVFDVVKLFLVFSNTVDESVRIAWLIRIYENSFHLFDIVQFCRAKQSLCFLKNVVCICRLAKGSKLSVDSFSSCMRFLCQHSAVHFYKILIVVVSILPYNIIPFEFRH